MPTFIILMLLAIVTFIVYRIKAWRMAESYKQALTMAKSHIALGSFIAAFGINRLLISTSPTILIICGILILYGGYIVYYNIKKYRWLAPYVVTESKQNVNGGQ